MMLIKSLLITSALFFFSQTSFALTLQAGDYQGFDKKNNHCRLFVREDGAVGLYYEGAYGDGLMFHPKSSQLNGNTLVLSGSADFGVGKAKILLSDEGVPYEAFMGVGPIFKFSYDVDCKNLVAQ